VIHPIEVFLATHPGCFCVDCLARAVGLPAGQISMVRHRLTESEAFIADRATCSACRKIRLVMRAA
jgi:hypothetical protein